MMMGAFPLGVGAVGGWSPPGWPVGEEPFLGRVTTGHGQGRLSKLGISYPVSVSFAGCNPTACADGKSGKGNRTVLSGLWVSAPPRRGWDGESQAGLGCEGGEVPALPLGGAGGLGRGLRLGHLVLAVLEPGLVFGGA